MRFELGQVVATPGVLRHLEANQINPLLLIGKHGMGDWGDLCKQDVKANEDALKYESRILSCYVIASSKVYVITEWDRSVTTLLLASEY